MSKSTFGRSSRRVLVIDDGGLNFAIRDALRNMGGTDVSAAVVSAERVLGEAPDPFGKMDFKPGELVRFEGKTWEVLCAYRLESAPFGWRYRIEESVRSADASGDPESRVIREPLESDEAAAARVSGIPRMGRRRSVWNEELLAGIASP